MSLSDLRIDAEASSLKRKLNELTTSQKPLKEGDDKSAEETTAIIEVCVFVVSFLLFCSKRNYGKMKTFEWKSDSYLNLCQWLRNKDIMDKIMPHDLSTLYEPFASYIDLGNHGFYRHPNIYSE